jgi:O-antigen ligase
VLAVGLIISFWLSPGLTGIFTKRFQHDFETTNPLSRLFIWENSAKVIAEHPVFGVGAGNFGAAYLKQVVVVPERAYGMGHAHSDYINIAAVNGLPGLLIYLAIWILILRRFLSASRMREQSGPGSALAFAALVASVGFLVTSLTEATFADEEVRQLLMAIWGAGLAGVSYDSD